MVVPRAPRRLVQARSGSRGCESCVLFLHGGPLAWVLFSKKTTHRHRHERKSALLEIKLGNCILHPFEKTRLFPFSSFSFSLVFPFHLVNPFIPSESGEQSEGFPFFFPRPLCFSPSRLHFYASSVNDHRARSPPRPPPPPPPPPLTLHPPATLLPSTRRSYASSSLRVYLFMILTGSSSRFICITSSHPGN